MREQLALLPEYLTGHLRLTLAALVIGVVVSVPAGVWAARRPSWGRVLMGVASVVQTIPGLALLAVMVPLLAALDVTSIGYLPAGIGLVLYSTLPILRNTITGLQGVDPACVEAAQGVGMTVRQQLLRVDLPLAAPVIMAGIRTSAVATVGTATLSTPVGAPSLGNFIFTGLQTRNLSAVLVGCLGAAVLALVLDALLGSVTRGLERRRRPPAVALSLLVLVVLAAFGGLVRTSARDAATGQTVRIGTKTFTEQYILGEILAQHLLARAGLHADVRPALGSTVAFDALVAGDLDAYVDYSGTLWTTILKRQDLPDRATLLAELASALEARHHVEVVARLGFENAYALAMRRDQATSLGVSRLSDLTRVAGRLRLGSDYEFLARPEWLAAKRTYGFSFAAERSMDPSLMYEAVAAGQVDLISAFSTDGRISSFDLVVLDDDRGAIPPYDAVVLVGSGLGARLPAAIDALASLGGAIDAETMRRLNRSVDQDGALPATVARDFLAGRGGFAPTPTSK
ncbi:MAG: glycine betaine ABC transporter substrate-binding protein [Vicinamibacterales bacterium]